MLNGGRSSLQLCSRSLLQKGAFVRTGMDRDITEREPPPCLSHKSHSIAVAYTVV